MEAADALIEIARIVKPVGIRGELKVLPFSRTPSELAKYEFFIVIRAGELPQQIRAVHFRTVSQYVVLKFSGLDSVDDAEKWRDCLLYIRRDQLSEPPPDEFYIRDLIGITVMTENGVELGYLRDILELPSNDIFQIQTAAGELLLPVISDVIINIDVSQRSIIVRIPEGLSDQK